MVLTCETIFPNNLSAVSNAVQYVVPSFHVRSFVSAAASGDALAPTPMFILFTAGRVTDAPAVVGTVEAAAATPALATGLPMT